MKTALIVAMDLERGIGKNNDLMWHLPLDMRFFKETTTGNIVVMGRKNYESIPLKYRPLQDRENAVLTRNSSYSAEGCTLFSSLEECMNSFENETERTVFIIGGGEIYKQALQLDLLDELYITHVDGRFGADTFFPEFDETQWNAETLFSHQKDERHEVGFSVTKYTRAKKGA